eukprot:1287087-Pleurochrysis_carterae.AAC.1
MPRCFTKLNKLLRTAVKVSSGEGGRKETEKPSIAITQRLRDLRESERGKEEKYTKFLTQSPTQARPPQAGCDATLSSMRCRGDCKQQHRRQLVMRVATLCVIVSSLPPPLYLPSCEPNLRRTYVGVVHAGHKGGLRCRQALRPKTMACANQQNRGRGAGKLHS